MSKRSGLTVQPIYRTWAKMKQRCLGTGGHIYPGIAVCDEWRDNFQAFYEYVSKLEHFGEEGYTLDRIDNGGNYEHGNVRWADKKTQQSNTRRNVFVEYKGERMTVEEAARRSGINKRTILSRVRSGDEGKQLFRPSAEIPPDIRRKIRREYAGALAKKFGCCERTIWNILKEADDEC